MDFEVNQRVAATMGSEDGIVPPGAQGTVTAITSNYYAPDEWPDGFQYDARGYVVLFDHYRHGFPDDDGAYCCASFHLRPIDGDADLFLDRMRKFAEQSKRREEALA